ncbi:hypothetical protein GGR01_003293 [Acetobacter oeni]|nr:hypothetical protein [Acetobacter oeni]
MLSKSSGEQKVWRGPDDHKTKLRSTGHTLSVVNEAGLYRLVRPCVLVSKSSGDALRLGVPETPASRSLKMILTTMKATSKPVLKLRCWWC